METYYYFIDGLQSVFTRHEPVDIAVYPMYKELRPDQVEYHLAHPEAKRWEIEHKDDPVPEPTLQDVKERKCLELDAYDSSPAVNSFTIGNQEMWLTKTDRVSLRFSVDAREAAGETEAELWSGTVKYVLPIALVKELLAAVELYASKCFNVTAAHKKAILDLETIPEVEAYDFKTGYPEKLSFDYNLQAA